MTPGWPEQWIMNSVTVGCGCSDTTLALGHSVLMCCTMNRSSNGHEVLAGQSHIVQRGRKKKRRERKKKTEKRSKKNFAKAKCWPETTGFDIEIVVH